MTISGPRAPGRRPAFRSLGPGILFAALTLLVACGGNDAVDVTPGAAKDLPAQQQATPPDPPPEVLEQPDVEVPLTVDPAQSNGWTRISPTAGLDAVTASPDGEVLLVSLPGRGLISHDRGRSWQELDWPGELRTRAAIDSSGRFLLVAGIGSAAGLESTAVWSRDGGRTWADTGLAAPAVAHFVVDSFLLAALDSGILASQDGGASGTVLIPNTDLDTALFEPIGIDVNARDPEEFFVVSASEGGSIRILRTPDAGETVETVADDFDLWGWTLVRFSPIGPLILSQGVGVLLSFDRGATWFVQNQGLEALAQDGRLTGLVDLAVLPNGNLPVAAGADAIFIFNPGGWERLPGPAGEIRALAIQGGDDPRLLAATSTGLWAFPVGRIATP